MFISEQLNGLFPYISVDLFLKKEYPYKLYLRKQYGLGRFKKQKLQFHSDTFHEKQILAMGEKSDFRIFFKVSVMFILIFS